MLKPPHPVAAAGYVAAMLVNPNNHALDGGPVTSEMEKEAVAELAAMLGLGEPNLGHLTVERDDREPRGAVGGARAASGQGRRVRRQRPLHARAHVPGPSHARARGRRPTPDGRIDLDALDAALRARRHRHRRAHRRAPPGSARSTRSTRRSRCASATACGSTSTPPTAASSRCSTTRRPGCARSAPADSVVIDPHKHGLQPYGCGAVLFADPGVGRLYAHDSPYTYFTSDSLHLGEISLECSRAGAAAAALWLTLRAVPLEPVLAAARRAALRLRRPAARVRGPAAAPRARAGHRHLPPPAEQPLASSTPRARRSCARAWRTPTTRCSSAPCRSTPEHLHGIERDAPSARILRSVLMKPEHESAADWLATRVEQLAARTRQGG